MVSLQSAVALTTIGLYLVVVLALGYRGWQVGTLAVDDWMAAGRGLGIVVLLFTYTATYHSAFAFLGIGGYVYGNGIAIFGTAFLWVGISGFLLWVLGSRIWLLGQKYGYITPADLLGDVYQSPLLAKLVSAVLIVFTFPYIAIQLVGSGLIFETATDGLVSFELGAALLVVVGVVYVWLGGLRAVAWTDTIQGVFMFGAMWLAGWVFVFTAYRGPTAFWHVLTSRFAEYLTLPGPAGVFTPTFYVTFWITFALGAMMLPHFFLRYVAARSPRVLKWAAGFGTAYLILFYVPTAFLALGAVSALPNLASPDMAIPAILYETLPVWFASIVMAGTVAAAMSTADSQLHAVTTLLTRDWYAAVAGETVTDQTVTRAAQVLVPLLGGISYWIAVQRVQFILDLAAVSLYNAAQVFPILIGALVWSRASREGALVGFSGGVLVTTLLTFGFVSLPPGFPGFVPGFYGLLVTTTLFVAISFVVGSTPASNVQLVQEYVAYANSQEWQTQTHAPDDD